MKEISINLPSPVELLPDFCNSYQVYIKREELIHEDFGGNKWRKLKYNIDQYYAQGHQTMITYGGPFSNHIAATAAVCAQFGIPSVGLIRGTYKDPNNPTLTKAAELGMKLHHVPKDAYKLKAEAPLIQDILMSYDNPMLIPEGGNNQLGVEGMKDLMQEVLSYDLDFDVVGVAAGTGATGAGIIKYCHQGPIVKVVNVLKNVSLVDEIRKRLGDTAIEWEVLLQYHFGGYARSTDVLQAFAQQFYDKYKIALDPIYNAKLFYGMKDLMRTNALPEHSKVLIINTGGYQGIDAYEYVHRKPWVIKHS